MEWLALLALLAGPPAADPPGLPPTLRHGKPITRMAFSPGGRLLACADGAGEVSLFELPSGRLRHRLAGQKAEIRSLAFSSDGLRLAIGQQARGEGSELHDKPALVHSWDTRGGRLLRSWEAGRWAIKAVAFVDAGRVLATYDPSGELRVWDVASGRRLGHAYVDFPPHPLTPA